MGDVVVVAVVDRQEKLLHDLCCLLFSECPFSNLGELIEEVPSSAVFHDDKDVLG